jgi:hypothetical protein
MEAARLYSRYSSGSTIIDIYQNDENFYYKIEKTKVHNIIQNEKKIFRSANELLFFIENNNTEFFNNNNKDNLDIFDF